MRIDTIRQFYPGGWEQYVNNAPNYSLSSDDEIAGIGFMAPRDVRAFIERIEPYGFKYLEKEADGYSSKDVVVVDQLKGPMNYCDWIEYGHLPHHGDSTKEIAACRLVGSNCNELYVYDGWEFERSHSHQVICVSLGEMSHRLKYQGNINGLDTYIDKQTRQKVYTGRS